MSNDPGSSRSPRGGWRLRLVWILLLGAACVVAASWGRTRLFDFADLRHHDPTPWPRPTANAPFIKSPDLVVDKMIEIGEITDQDMVYDLGCGDGKIVITAAVKRGCRGVGFDLNPDRVAESIENVKLHGVEHLVTIKQDNVFNVDLRDANVIVMYLLPQMVQDLVPQFDQCPPGVRIVSHDWKIDGVQEEQVVTVPVSDTDNHLVFLYVTPLKRLPPPPPRKKVLK